MQCVYNFGKQYSINSFLVDQHISKINTQRHRIDLNKMFLPRLDTSSLPQHKSLYPIVLKSAGVKIPYGGNFFTKKNEFECNYCKAVFVLVKISF